MPDQPAPNLEEARLDRSDPNWKQHLVAWLRRGEQLNTQAGHWGDAELLGAAADKIEALLREREARENALAVMLAYFGDDLAKTKFAVLMHGEVLEADVAREIVRRALPATESAQAEHPCPKGDDCALNEGAVECKACGRKWPPDETWDARVTPSGARPLPTEEETRP